jgi:hypothetical protein
MQLYLYWLLLVTINANTCTGPCETQCSITCPACIETTICLEIVPLMETITLLSNRTESALNATKALSILCVDIVPHSVFARTTYTVTCTTDTCTPIICSRGSCDGGGDTSCNANCDECAPDRAVCVIALDKLEMLAPENVTGSVSPLVIVVKESIAALCSSAVRPIQWLGMTLLMLWVILVAIMD